MDLKLAVKKTLAYANYFHFPLSPEEIYLWFISSRPVTFLSIKKYLPVLKPKEIKQKELLRQNTLQKERKALELVRLAKFIPGLRLLALTGSVAIGNSQKDDDLDLLIITTAHTLWLVRPVFLLLLSLKYKRRHPGDNSSRSANSFCPNLWLDMDALTVPPRNQNLYTAHEVLQIKPLFDRGETYGQFILANHWTKKFLANAYSFRVSVIARSPKATVAIQKNLDCFGSNTRLAMTLFLFPLNYLSFLLQYLYMHSKITTEKVSLHAAYFHKTDLSDSLERHLKNKSL